MNIAFVCWRPFQLMNIINIIYNDIEGTRRASCDLYLQKNEYFISRYNRIIETGLFKKIVFFEDNEVKNRKQSYRELILQYLFPRKAIKDFTGDNDVNTKKYDLLFASGWNPFFICMCEKNLQAKVILYEDGMASYTGQNDLKNNTTVLNKLFYKITGKGKLSINVAKQYVYKPEWVVDDQSKYEKLPAIDQELCEIVQKINDFHNPQYYSDVGAIYLDQPITWTSDSWDKNLKNRVISYIHEKKRLIIRYHPTQAIKNNNKYTVDIKAPMWELVSAYLDDDTLLISVFSTAVFTPYYIYGKKMPVILLYKMALDKNSSYYETIDRLGSTLLQKYPEGFLFIPETIEDFEGIIQNV